MSYGGSSNLEVGQGIVVDGLPDGAAAIDEHLFNAVPEGGQGAGGLGGATAAPARRGPCYKTTAV